MFHSFALVVATLSPAFVTGPVARSSGAFDFSASKKDEKPNKGLLLRVLDRVDGGDFHGYDNTDGTSHKANDYLKTMTVRLKLRF